MNNHQPSEYEIDFDAWKTLAQKDPAAFEAKRRQCIEALIEGAPVEKRRRLRGIQWQVDQIRSLSRTPLASCIAISNMMWDSLYQLNQQQRELTQSTSIHPVAQPTASVSATVLPFRARQV